MLVFVIALVLLNFVSGQVIFQEACPESVKPMKNFDLARYMGKWYEIEKYFARFELNRTCVYGDYSLNADGASFTDVHVSFNTQTQKISSSSAQGVVVGAKGEARFNVTQARPGSTPGPLWILGTDYETYTCIWSCRNRENNTSSRLAWISTRERHPTQKAVDKARNVFKSLGVSLAEFEPMDQSNCNN